MSTSRERVVLALLLLLLLVAAARNTWMITRQIVDVPRAPQWDMARRGLDGIHLAEALRRGDVIDFISRVHHASVWPPVFPLLETPAFLIFGQDYRVPRLLVSLLYFLCVPAAFWAGWALDQRWGAHLGLVAAGFLCASPLFHLYASLVMLEVPGTLLLLLCLGAYARAQGSGSLSRWRLAWCLTTLLFFCKYNYGLMWLLPLLLVEIWRSVELRFNGIWTAALRHLGSWLRSIDLLKPWTLFVFAYLVLVLGVLLSGGFETEIAGTRLRVRSIGGLLYYLYVLWFLRSMRRPRHKFERFQAWCLALEPRHRQFVRWVMLPIGVWMLLPPHAREFFQFLQNRSTGPRILSWESLSFYPRVFAVEFSQAPWLGVLLLNLAFLPFCALPRLETRQRLLTLALLCGVMALVFHPYKLPRFALTVAPLVWLSAAWVVVRALAWMVERMTPKRESAWTSTVTLALCGLIMTAAVAEGVHARRLQGGFTYRTVPRSTEAVMHHIHQVARESESTVVLGTWNLLSPWLLEWHLRARYPDLESSRRPLTGRQLDKLRPEVLCDDLDARDVIVLDPVPGQRPHPLMRGFAEEIANLRPVYVALDQSDCFELAETKSFPKAGYRLRHYQRREER